MPGSGYVSASFDPTQITGMVGDIFPTAGLGEIVRVKNKTYQYVRFDNGVGNVAAVAGRGAYWKDIANFVVTSDFSDSQGGGTELCLTAGVFLYAMTDLYYGWIQTGGYNASVYVSAAGAVGQRLLPSTTDGQFTTVATGSVTAAQAGAQRVGTQLTAAVSNLCAAYLEILI
jgi:hypothetical protein